MVGQIGTYRQAQPWNWELHTLIHQQQREGEYGWVGFWNLKAYTQRHTFSIKAPLTPTRPPLLIFLILSNNSTSRWLRLKYRSLWRPFLFKPPQAVSKLLPRFWWNAEGLNLALVATASVHSRMHHRVINNESHNTLSHPPAVWLILPPLPRFSLLGNDVNVLFGGQAFLTPLFSALWPVGSLCINHGQGWEWRLSSDANINIQKAIWHHFRLPKQR